MLGIGERFYEERRRLDLSQTEMGKLGGVTINTYANYESEKRFPDAECLVKFYTGGVDVLYVLTGVRNNQELSNQENVLLEQFNRADPRMQRTVLGMLQIYNTSVES